MKREPVWSRVSVRRRPLGFAVEDGTDAPAGEDGHGEIGALGDQPEKRIRRDTGPPQLEEIEVPTERDRNAPAGGQGGRGQRRGDVRAAQRFSQLAK